MKKALLLLALLAFPASAFAIAPLVGLVVAAGAMAPYTGIIESIGMGIFFKLYWPLIAALAGFYFFMQIFYSVSQKSMHEMTGTQAKLLESAIWGGYLILAISFASIMHFFGGFEALALIMQEQQ